MIFRHISFSCILVFAALLISYPSTGESATFCVNEQTDDGTGNADDCSDAACDGAPGNCSLRDAILKANSNPDEDTINFSLSLSSPLVVEPGAFFGLPQIGFSLNIDGPGADVLTIDANGGNRVFWFTGGDSDRINSITGLTLTGIGGGPGTTSKVIQNDGDLTITDCVITGPERGISSSGNSLTIFRSTISGNTDPSNDLTGGGLNFGRGVLSVIDSTFSGNSMLTTQDADEGGGAIGIFDGDDVTAEFINVTVSGNQTNTNGGGIWISDDCAECGGSGIIDVTLTNVTIADNTADMDGDGGSGGGLYVSLTKVGSMVRLNNTLIGDNMTGGLGTAPDCLISGVDGISNGSNLVEDPDSACSGLPTGMDITGEDPLLGSLTDNPPGGTETQAIAPPSPAIDAASDADCPGTDQRGVPRPQGPNCDIGAFEAVVCGDGTVGPGEDCEPGTCCTDTCQFEPAGTPCDGGGTCNATGVCSTDNGDGGGGCSLNPKVTASSAAGGLLLSLLLLGSLFWYRRCAF